MGSKNSDEYYLGLLAFVAMFINVIYWIICIINNQRLIIIVSERIRDVMLEIRVVILFISTCLLSVVVLTVAHGWAKSQSRGWYILYWIFVVISVLAISVGFTTYLTKNIN